VHIIVLFWHISHWNTFLSFPTVHRIQEVKPVSYFWLSILFTSANTFYFVLLCGAYSAYSDGAAVAAAANPSAAIWARWKRHQSIHTNPVTFQLLKPSWRLLSRALSVITEPQTIVTRLDYTCSNRTSGTSEGALSYIYSPADSHRWVQTSRLSTPS